MKKSIVSILIGLMMVGIGGSSWAGVTATEVICTGCVNDTDIANSAVTNGKIADAAVTNSKIVDGVVTANKVTDSAITEPKLANGAVTNGKIADGAVTDAKILGVISGVKLGSHGHYGNDIVDGTITSTKIANGAITDEKITGPISTSKLEKPASVMVVAKSGGDYTTITNALNAINPTADNRYVIKVMPGKYQELIRMKSYVHLQGSGPEVTIIDGHQWWDCAAILGNSVTEVGISGFTITGGTPGIEIGGVSQRVTISGNWIEDNHGVGIYSYTSAPLTITNNVVKGNHYQPGIRISSGATANNAIITKYNYIAQNYWGIYLDGDLPSLILEQNTISDNDYAGLALATYPVKIFYNRITNNGTADIYNYNYGTDLAGTNISFNVFDTITGTYGNPEWHGNYNVKSDGTPVR